MGEFETPYDYPPLKDPSSKPVLTPDGLGIGASTFLELLDTFNDYTGHALKFLRVSADETRIEVTSISFISDRNYVHNQPVASNNWGTINHALGKYPSVDIYDEFGNPAHANIDQIDIDNVSITSDVAFAGVAYFN